ncbi:retrotransposon protein, putative, ty1-copia subclass [Tanacetum coccineum]
MVNAMFLSPGLSHGIWGKAIISLSHLLDKIPCKENKIVLMKYGSEEDYLISVYKCGGYLVKISKIERSSRIDDEVVQDKRQRDDNDLQDKRQDQPKEEEKMNILLVEKQQLPRNGSIYKWIIKKKMKADGTIDKYKARLVIKVFRQREAPDYFDTYLPLTRITTIRMVLAIAVLKKLEVYQMDVKKAFLNEDLEKRNI